MSGDQININILGNALIEIKELKNEFKGLSNSVNVFNENSSNSFTNLQKKINNISFVNITQGLDNFQRTLNDITGPGLQFEQSVADLSAITGIAGDDLKELSSTARNVGVDSGLGAQQATEAFKLLASQISVENIGIDGLKVLQKETIALAQASGMDLTNAANSMASAINQFGLEASEASRVINVLAAGSKYGAAEIPQLADTFKVAGAAANAAGMDIEGLAGVAEVLSKNAMVGSEAGTHLRNVIVRMQTQLGVDLGETPMSEALKALQPRLQDTEFLVKTFGESSLGAAQFLIANADAVDEMTSKVTDTQTAYEQAEIRNNTLSHSLQKVGAFFDDVKISVFEFTGSLLPGIEVLTSTAKGVSTVVPALNLLKNSYDFLRVAKNREAIATMFNTGVKKIATVATSGLAMATGLLNAAFVASPIGWVVVGLGALTAGVLYAWENFEGFRASIYGVWDATKQVFGNISSFIGDMMQPFFDAVGFIMDGDWGSAASALGKGLFNVATGGFQFLGSALDGTLTAGVSEAFEKGQEKGRKAFREEEAKEDADFYASLSNQNKTTKSKSPSLDDFFKADPSTENVVSKTLGTGDNKSSISSGASFGGVKNNNVRIENLVRNLTINASGVEELRQKLREEIQRILTASIRDTEQMLA